MALKTIDGIRNRDGSPKEFHYLELTVEDRLALLEKVIALYHAAEQRPAAKRQKFIREQAELLCRVEGAKNPEAAEYIERKLRPGGDDPVPLEHTPEPEFFPARQHGPSPITLMEMKANYESHLAKPKEAANGNR